MNDAARRSDERLAGQGDIVAAGRALLARVRDGTLSLGRVQVAAHLGDGVAQAGTPAFEAGHAARDAVCALLAAGDDTVAVWVLPWLLAPAPAGDGPR